MSSRWLSQLMLNKEVLGLELELPWRRAGPGLSSPWDGQCLQNLELWPPLSQL